MPPKGRDFNLLPASREYDLRTRAIDAERRAQALSRRLDVFMAGGLLRRLWVAAWRGNPPEWGWRQRGEA